MSGSSADSAAHQQTGQAKPRVSKESNENERSWSASKTTRSPHFQMSDDVRLVGFGQRLRLDEGFMGKRRNVSGECWSAMLRFVHI